MSILNNISNFLGRKNNTQLEAKVSDLEILVNKSLSSTLAGIIGSQFIELQISKLENAYTNNYVINRGVNLLAQSIAQLPLVVYKGDNQLDSEFTFPNFDLQNPGPDLSLYELLYRSLVYYFYRGEMFIYINLEAPKIILEVLNPKLMELDKEGNWKYNRTVTIPKEQVLFLPLFNPDSTSGRGLSPVEVVKEEIMNDYKAREYNSKFFENFGKVGGMLEPAENSVVTKEDMKLTVDQFNQLHSGSSNAHKILGLPPGVKYVESSQSMKDLEFAEGRKDVRDRILGILGIHKSIFGVTDQVDRAVAEAAMRQLWIHTLKPNAIRIQEKLNQGLMNVHFQGYQVYFDFESVEELQESNTEVLTRAKMMRELGYTMNEINDYYDLGMEEVTDAVGSMRFVPSTLIPATDMEVEVVDSPPEKIINNYENLDKIVKLLSEEEKIVENEEIEVKSKKTYIRQYDRLQKSIQRRIKGKMGKHYASQLGQVLGLINSNKSIKALDEVTLMSEIKNLLQAEKIKLTSTLSPVYSEASKEASAFGLASIHSSIEPSVAESVVNDMLNKIKGVEDSTYKLIRAQVKESIMAGETTAQLTDRIKSVYQFNSSYAAKRVALTESANLVNRSINEEYKKSGVEKKRWLTAGDSIVRDTHIKCGDDGVIPFDSQFSNGLLFPGDPKGTASEVINCRCALQPVIGE